MSTPAQAAQTAVEYTISQDFAAGQIAEQDKNLQGFLDNGQVGPTGPGIHSGNHALQDYQMQLMLLEQQNKKRLLFVRQEEQKLEQQREASTLVSQQMGATRKRSRGDTQAEQACRNSSSASRTRKSQRKYAGGSVTNIERPEGNTPQESSATTTNRGAIGQDVSDMHRDTSRSARDRGHEESFLPYSRIIYRINCTEQQPLRHHAALAFEDAPVPSFPRDPHMEGTRPIYDLDSLLNNEDDVAFIIVRETYCSKGALSLSHTPLSEVWYENIWLKSMPLRSALTSTACCYINNPSRSQYETTTTNKTSLVATREIDSPYLFLYHHRDRLGEYTANHPDALSHIRALLNYANDVYGADYREADELLSKGLVTNRHLIKLFVPNELVFTYTDGEPTAYVVRQWPTKNKDGSLRLECWSWKSNGSKFVRHTTFLRVATTIFDEEQIEIQRLHVSPLIYQSPETRSNLELRGEKHWSLGSQKYVSYTGWNTSHDQYYPDSRFMIDNQTYLKLHPHAAAFDTHEKERLPFDRRPSYLRSNRDGSADIYCLMAPDTYGFYFTEKKWINLSIDNIQAVEWNKSAFDRLVLPFQTKELVRALVTVRNSQRGVRQGLGLAGKREDIISGKGNGLIMLLHGGPGTGKTLTAGNESAEFRSLESYSRLSREVSYDNSSPSVIQAAEPLHSVAETAEMPLYRVTCGDIGTSAEAVEKYLNNVLYLGKTWNCVLLLDEADVFLEERSMSDLKRNSLVSVFLRILEYYDGILMLTSNRVGTFDEAFKSRIQVALHYEALTRSSRRKIWQNFFDMLREDNEDVIFDDLRDHMDELADLDMNGRQIRNSLTTARQLAIYKKEPLAWHHLEQAIKIAADFSHYLKRVHGHTDEQWAREEKIRVP